MKLWEGNVFIVVCLSVYRGPYVTITHDALDLTVQSPLHIRPEDPLTPKPVLPPSPKDMRLGTPWGPNPLPASDIWWPSLETCSSLFIRPHCTETLLGVTSCGCWRNYGQRKRAVRILLECFLVLNCANFTLTFIMGMIHNFPRIMLIAISCTIILRYLLNLQIQ